MKIHWLVVETTPGYRCIVVSVDGRETERTCMTDDEFNTRRRNTANWLCGGDTFEIELLP